MNGIEWSTAENSHWRLRIEIEIGIGFGRKKKKKFAIVLLRFAIDCTAAEISESCVCVCVSVVQYKSSTEGWFSKFCAEFFGSPLVKHQSIFPFFISHTTERPWRFCTSKRIKRVSGMKRARERDAPYSVMYLMVFGWWINRNWIINSNIYIWIAFICRRCCSSFSILTSSKLRKYRMCLALKRFTLNWAGIILLTVHYESPTHLLLKRWWRRQQQPTARLTSRIIGTRKIDVSRRSGSRSSLNIVCKWIMPMAFKVFLSSTDEHIS